MRFKNFQLIINQGIPTIEDIINISENGSKFVKDYYSDWYEIQKTFFEDRFLWIYCQYNNAKLYRDVVLDGSRDVEERNPRGKSQVELYKQLFFCYDWKTKLFYTNNMDKRGFVQYYFSNALSKDVEIKNIYTSLEEFQDSVKAIKQLKFVQERNIQNFIQDSIFQQQVNIFGLDCPEKITMQIDYGNTPIEQAKKAIQKFRQWKDSGNFESIILIGVDDTEVEQSFDFSSLIKSIPVEVLKNENGRYDPEEVKVKFLNEIR
ncbi:MAG: hypothetical protein ACK5MV_13675 [Aminipila sp.]